MNILMIIFYIHFLYLLCIYLYVFYSFIILIISSFVYQEGDIRDSSEERIVASIVLNEDTSIQSLDAVNHSPIDIAITDDSPAIIIASRPHSHETVKYIEDSRNENTNSHNKINIHEVDI